MFRLHCKVQNYAWGRQGSNSLVAQIDKSTSGNEIDETKPYAEYWMGDHVNGPSQIFINANDKQLCDIIGDQEFCTAFD